MLSTRHWATLPGWPVAPPLGVYSHKVPLVKCLVKWPVTKNAAAGLPNAEAHVPFVCQ